MISSRSPFAPHVAFKAVSACAGLCAILLCASAPPAAAQFDLFGGGQERSRQNAPVDPAESDIMVRLDRLEGQLRQFTGLIEQLQYRNQQLEAQLKRMQEDNEYRFQQMGNGGRGGAAPAAPARAPQTPPPGRRSDAYDPGQDAPRASGVGQGTQGTMQGTMASAEAPQEMEPLGAPGGREAGAPLNLSGLADSADIEATGAPGRAPTGVAPGGLAPGPRTLNDQLANPQPQPQRGAAPQGERLATLPPSASPKDEFDLGVGYVKRKDYALANQALNDFLRRHPADRLAGEAQYWLGESFFQQQKFHDAARSFLTVTTKYENNAKAPESMLRLSQSLAAIGQKDTACAALREINTKYPRASASVKQGVAREQKRANC